MQFNNPSLDKNYKFWQDKLFEEKGQFHTEVISVKDVLDAHFFIVDFFLEEGEEEKAVGGIGPRDLGLLVSAVSRQSISYGKEDKWSGHFEKCSTLFYGLIKNHAFHDCNKRTALLTSLYYLQKINRVPKITHRELERLTTRTAKDELNKYRRYSNHKHKEDSDIYFLSEYFRSSTRKNDKRSYVITYKEFNRILNSFGFKLENPNNNHINVIKMEKVSGFFGFGKDKIQETRIEHIPFPGWTREVSKKIIHKVRIKAKLTDLHGVDSHVFYRDAEPLSGLINEYDSLLRRLAFK